MLEEMKQFAAEVEELMLRGLNLREICKWSYEMREAGHNVPYLCVAECDESGFPVYLSAAPTKQQPTLNAFFNEKAPGCRALPRYTLTVTEDGVHFMERLGKGKNNFKVLTQPA